MDEVAIQSPDAGWPAAFRHTAGEVRTVLGPLALRIDHIGSTSVPGLAAKDVIDAQVTVIDEQAMNEAAERLERAGWRVARAGMTDHIAPGGPPDAREWVKRVSREPPDHRRVNLHIRIAGRANHRYALLFRDYLRGHPTAAAAYAAFKRRAAALLPNDLNAYADLKDPVCDLVYLPAEDWAARTTWTPGSADA
jgi:GrpB-like predicted nucleotidyltransferase (UPF0157 family)